MNWYKIIKTAISPTEHFNFNNNPGVPNKRKNWVNPPELTNKDLDQEFADTAKAGGMTPDELREMMRQSLQGIKEEKSQDQRRFAFHGMKVKMDEAYDIVDGHLLLQVNDNYMEVPFSSAHKIIHPIEDILSEYSIQPHKEHKGSNEIWTYLLDSPILCTIFFKGHEPIDISFEEDEMV